MGVAPGPKSETARMKVRFKYRQEHQHYRHLHHPVFDSGYTQWPLAPVRFGYPDPPHRQGPVSLGLEFPLQRVQPLALFFRTARDAFDGLSIHTRTAPVSRDSLERVLQYVPAHDVPVETPEPILRFGFGFAIERALELPNLLGRYYSCSRRTITLSFAPRLRLRTSRVPSPRFEPGQMFGADVPRLIFPAHDSATTNSSDCGNDTRPLPALSVVALPDVLATPTPPETARADGYPPRRHRPSSSHQRFGDSGSGLLRGSLAVVHLHSGPSVLCPDCLLPSLPCGRDRHQAVLS